MAELEIQAREVHASPKVVLLELSGGVDAKSYPKLEQALKTIHKQGCCRLVLNLGGLRFMNEADKLLRYDTAFRRAGGGIVLYEVPAKLRIVLQTLELDRQLKTLTRLEDAIAELAELSAPKGQPATAPPKKKTTAVNRAPQNKKTTGAAPAPRRRTTSAARAPNPQRPTAALAEMGALAASESRTGSARWAALAIVVAIGAAAAYLLFGR